MRLRLTAGHENGRSHGEIAQTISGAGREGSGQNLLALVEKSSLATLYRPQIMSTRRSVIEVKFFCLTASYGIAINPFMPPGHRTAAIAGTSAQLI